MQDIPADTRIFLASIVERFSPGLRSAYAYGSGVFKQANHKNTADNMIDLIFVVDDARRWHENNLRRYRKHYSMLGSLGPRAVQAVQVGIIVLLTIKGIGGFGKCFGVDVLAGFSFLPPYILPDVLCRHPPTIIALLAMANVL